MRIKKGTYQNRALFIAVFFQLTFAMQAQAQSEKALKDSIKSATVNIYEDPDKAIRYGDSIFKIAKEDKTRISALTLIANAYSSKRDYEKSLEYVVKANQLSEKINDPLMRINITTKIAILYQQLKIYEKTIQYLDQAEKLILEYPNQDSVAPYLSNNYIVRGFIYKEKLNCDIAISFFDKGISYLNRNTNISRANISIAYYNKGNCYIMLGDNEKAKESFNKAIELAKVINANSLRAFALKGLAKVYTQADENDKAIETLNDALDISRNVGDLILNQTIYEGLFENYLAMNDWDNYLEYHTKYLQTQLSVKQSERGSVSNTLDEAAKEKALAFRKASSKYDSLVLMLTLFSILAVLVFIVNERRLKKSIKNLQVEVKNLQQQR